MRNGPRRLIRAGNSKFLLPQIVADDKSMRCLRQAGSATARCYCGLEDIADGCAVVQTLKRFTCQKSELGHADFQLIAVQTHVQRLTMDMAYAEEEQKQHEPVTGSTSHFLWNRLLLHIESPDQHDGRLQSGFTKRHSEDQRESPQCKGHLFFAVIEPSFHLGTNANADRWPDFDPISGIPNRPGIVKELKLVVSILQ